MTQSGTTSIGASCTGTSDEGNIDTPQGLCSPDQGAYVWHAAALTVDLQFQSDNQDVPLMFYVSKLPPAKAQYAAHAAEDSSSF